MGLAGGTGMYTLPRRTFSICRAGTMRKSPHERAGGVPRTPGAFLGPITSMPRYYLPDEGFNALPG